MALVHQQPAPSECCPRAFYGRRQQLNSGHVNDPDTTDVRKVPIRKCREESKKLSRELDKYFIEHYWRVDIFPFPLSRCTSRI